MNGSSGPRGGRFFLFHLLPACVLFSAIFWMPSTVDYLGWAVAEVTAACCLLALLWRKPSVTVPATAVAVPSLLFVLLCSAMLSWSANFHATLTAVYKILFAAIALVLFSSEPRAWEKALLFAAMAVSGAFVLSFPIGGWSIGHPGLVGGFLALTSVACAGLAFTAPGPLRAAAIALSVMVPIGLIYLNSLGPLLAWFAGLTVQCLRFDKKKLRILPWLALALLGASFIRAPDNPLHALLQRKRLDPHSFERIQIWKDSWKYFASHPWLGTGLGTYRDYYPEYKKIAGFRNAPYAHNEPLQLLCEVGLAGAFFLGWAAFAVFLRRKEGDKNLGVWAGVAVAAGVQALVDFNLHYPPVLAMFAFPAGLMLPARTTDAAVSRKILTPAILLLAALFALPGAADVIFRRGYPQPETRQAAALTALRLDPFNALYRFESRRLRDLMIAVDLEPRNVWYRRAAARFFFEQWDRSGDEENLDAALDQYGRILRLAPNVAQFQLEAEELAAQRKISAP